jgi:hypothetical protein
MIKMTQPINQSTNQSLRRCKQFLKFRRSVVTAMLLLNTLPVFAQTTDVIPTEGVWTTYFGDQERTFNDLQSACNAEFDYNMEINKGRFSPACRVPRLTGKYLYEPHSFYYDGGIGYCLTEFPRLTIKIVDGYSFLDCSDEFTEGFPIYINYDIPTCPAPANGQRAAADCTQTVSLTPVSGQAEPRPKGSEGDGKSTYDLIAKVTEGNQPKAGMALTFTVEVEPGSGNHPLNPPDRPPGILSVKSGTTNASGEVKVTFTSPIFSGKHTVTVTCAKCTGTKKDDIATFTVKVPNLIKTPADINWRFISTDNYHKNNNASTATQTVYYLTQPAYTGLIELTKYMVNNGWKTNSEKPTSVGLNDASLEWGGKFYSYPGSGSIYPNWTGIKSSGKQYAHVEHRLGVQIDLRTTDVSNELEKQMYQKICNPQDGKYPVQAKLLWHTGVQKCKNAKGVLVSCTPEHYHAYLLGDINSSLGGGKCSSTPN